MDTRSQGAHDLVNALAQCTDELISFGSNLYLRHKGSRWTNNLVVSGGRTQKDKDAGYEYERSFFLIGSLNLSKSRAVAFTVTFCWGEELWAVKADVAFEDDDIDGVERLFELPATETQNLDEAIALLAEATRWIIHHGETTDWSYLLSK